MSLDKFTRLYLDWVNNFISIERFMEYHNLTEEEANFIINTGRSIMSFTPRGEQ